jgi:hypothetical protein
MAYADGELREHTICATYLYQRATRGPAQMMRFTVFPAISREAAEFMDVRNRRANVKRPIDPAAVRVRVLDGQAVTTVWGSYVGGDVFETSAKQAERLVELGIVELVVTDTRRRNSKGLYRGHQS